MLSRSFAVAALASAVVAQNTPNLTALLAATPDLSNLTSFVTLFPQLASTLTSATNITIFAPTNEAFAKVLATPAGQALMADTSLIEPLLQYHVLSGVVLADQIKSTPAFPKTLLTNATYTNVTGGQVVDAVVQGSNAEIITGLLEKSTVVTPNVNFTGGVVHIIDQVLTIPENVSATATAFNLTSAADALTKTNLLNTVEGLKDITIFVPNNEAFAAIAPVAANLTTDQLANILEYHVINGTVAYSSTLQPGQVTTLQGGNVVISITDGKVMVNNATVVTPDVILANGVAHVIDSVLMPNSSTSGSGSGGSPTTSGGSGSSPTASGSGTSPSASGSSGAAPPTSTGAASGQSAAIGTAALFGLGAIFVGAL